MKFEEPNILIPDDGKILTNGETFGFKNVELSENDSKDNWYEITTEEYEKLIADEGGDT